MIIRMSFKTTLKELLPPLLRKLGRRMFGSRKTQLRFTGDYREWGQAEQAATGYAAPKILDITRAAMRKLRAGQAAFERDSVLFDHAEPPFALIAALLRAASKSGGRLRVLDFGGALGSSYYQCRPWLDGIGDLRWCVVEQAGHVACGRAEFSDGHLGFYGTAEECIGVEQPNVLLMSGVLQYLPAPYDCLAGLLSYQIPHVIVDRTAFLSADRDRLTIQQVPPSIYPATYPAWFLSKSRFLACFTPSYRLLQAFPALDKTEPEGEPAFYEGFIFESQAKS